jgi:hypothetical protein
MRRKKKSKYFYDRILLLIRFLPYLSTKYKLKIMAGASPSTLDNIMFMPFFYFPIIKGMIVSYPKYKKFIKNHMIHKLIVNF